MVKNRIVSELLAAATGKHSDSDSEASGGREEGSHLQEQLRGAVARTEQLVTKYPVVALGSALVAGVLLGFWVKRR